MHGPTGGPGGPVDVHMPLLHFVPVGQSLSSLHAWQHDRAVAPWHEASRVLLLSVQNELESVAVQYGPHGSLGSEHRA